MPHDEQPRDSESGRWFVYIVECADGSLYTGITTDLERRVDEHNAGTGARYTCGRRPVILRYSERRLDRSQASAREAGIKALSRAEKERLIARGF